MAFVTTRQLKDLGWTPTQIALLKQDKKRFVTVPHGYFYGGDGFKSQMYQTRFDKDWVEEIQGSQRWKDLEDKKMKRLSKKLATG